MGDKTAVVIDQHPLWTRALSDLLADLGVQVFGTATSYADGIALVRQHAPDIVVSEFGRDVGDLGAEELIAAAREANAEVKCISVGDESALPHLDRAFAAGVAACCLRTAHADDFATAIRQLFDRSIYFAESHDAALRDLGGGEPSRPQKLTRREEEILRLVAHGHSNAYVASELWVTEQTIKFHLSNVYRKLAVSNRTEASRWAQANGLLATPGSSDANRAAQRAGADSPARPHLRDADGTRARNAGGADPLLSAA